MSDMPIEHMDFKQLRNEVQLLRDELSLMRRKYEDILYNLDDDNFSSKVIKEKNDMKTSIEITEEGIKTKVSKEDFESTISQTAESISSIVSEFVDVSKAVEVTSTDKLTDTNKIYVIRERDADGALVSETFYHYNTISKDWKPISADGIIYSLFEQKQDGFYLKGDVKVDGSCILTESLKFNSTDKPLDVEYSATGTGDWHSTFVEGSDKFMHIKIGAEWSDAMKIVGSDGLPGPQGPSGTFSYDQVYSILQNSYNIERTSIGQTSISSPKIIAADIYAPNIWGEELTLLASNASNSSISNRLNLTPTSMYLYNSYSGEAKTKFYVDLGEDTSNSLVKMRLGTGTSTHGEQALNIEKYDDEIRIGSYRTYTDSKLTDFAGMIIKPSTGAVTFTGTVQAIAVFG